jgi:hypothetical protein
LKPVNSYRKPALEVPSPDTTLAKLLDEEAKTPALPPGDIE